MRTTFGVPMFMVFLFTGLPSQNTYGQLPVPERMPGGFTVIFNGRDLTGWHNSAEFRQGNSPWVVEDGMLVGRHAPWGNGGLILTDRGYGDFELHVETRSTFGCDGGIFLRSNEAGQSYQVMHDHYSGGNVGGIFMEGLGTREWRQSRAYKSPGYPRHWNRDNWNSLRIRITGQPPNIAVWMNGVFVTNWTGEDIVAGDTGMIGFQMHGGKRIWTDPEGNHAYRNIAIKELR